MVKSFGPFLILGVVVSANEAYTYKYMQYLSKQNKSYSSLEEFNMRLNNFIAVDQWIENWNSQPEKTNFAGHNFLSDWTQAEKDVISGKAAGNAARRAKDKEARLSTTPNSLQAPYASYPADHNWNNGINVGAVQNQLHCGDCYAFAATGAVQSAMSITYAQQVELYSVQQITSCSQAYGNDGCNGGQSTWALEYLQVNPIVSAAQYPFNPTTQLGNVTACAIPRSATQLAQTQSTPYVAVECTGTQPCYPTQAQMQQAIYTTPNTVYVDASQPVFQNYVNGTITSSSCGTTVDHAVLAVGYATSATGDNYWIVQNSWGIFDWGVKGYGQIGMQTGAGICGINQDVFYPLVKKPK